MLVVVATYSLSGTGTQTLTTGTGALYVTITTLPSGSGHGAANPTDYYGIGLIRPGNATAYWEPFTICGGPQWLPVPAGTTRIGYALLGGAVVSVAEVAGSSPLAFPLASLPDVAIASPSDAQVLAYQASSSKWINATPTGGGGGSGTGAGARVYKTTSTSITSASYPVILTWPSVRWDTGSFWSSGSNTRLTAGTAGKHLITATIEFSNNNTGMRAVQFRVNGTTLIGAGYVTMGGWNVNIGVSATTIWDCAASDYVEVIGYQDSGSTLNVVYDSAFSPEFSMYRLA